MAKPVRSIWTVTWERGTAGALVLVEPSLLLEDEFSGFSSAQKTEPGDYLEAEDQEYLALGNTGRVIKWTVYRDHPTPAAARDYIFQLEQSIPVNKQGTVTFEITGGSTWTASHCAFKSWATVPVRLVGKHRTATSFEVECGKVSLGTPAGPDPVGLNNAPLNLSRHAAILNAAGTPAGYKEGVALWENTGTGDDAVQATAGNQPRLMVGPALYLPGVAGNRFSVAATPAEIGFEVRWAGILPTYTPAARICLMSKWDAAANKRGWALFVEPSGQVTLAVSTDGTAASITEWTSTMPLGMSPGAFVALEVRRLGSSSLYWNLYPDLTWSSFVQFSPEMSAPSLQPARYSDVHLVVGATDNGNANASEMRVLQVRYWADATIPLSWIQVDWSGEGSSNVPSATRAYAGTDPMIEMKAGNSCARFDGANDSLSLPAPVPLNAATGCSIFLFCQVHRKTGVNDLVFLGSDDADPRVLLRVDEGALKLIVRRLDGEAPAEISTNVALGAYYISASIDFVNGTARLYTNREPRAAGNLTSAGVTSATDSSETRIGAGQGGANPANLDVLACHVIERATDPIEHNALWIEIMGVNGF